MPDKSGPGLGINAWLEDELYQEYLHDRAAIDESWKALFENGHRTNGLAAQVPSARPETAPPPVEGDLEPLRGPAAAVARNMEASLSIPVATSQRTIAVKVVDENRTIINQHLSVVGQSKVSYTHLIAWAVIKALRAYPNLNSAYVERDGQAFRLRRSYVNFGVAVDVAGKDGARSLVVPNIRNAEKLNFQQFLSAYDDLVARARAGKLTLEDFQDTTISLTNPGTVGTVGSVPRLMPGQGAIIATGAIDYPAEFQGAAPETRALLGISKVMTITCTYDHRIIQGAESGLFLARVQALLQGDSNFYEDIFADLRLPYQPAKWEPDRSTALPGAGADQLPAAAKQAAVLQLINAYRVRGHLIADLDPLGSKPSYHPELDPANYGLTIWDLDRHFITGSLAMDERDGAPYPTATLREILEILRQTYCGKMGCEYMNIQVPEQKRWLQLRLEPASAKAPLDSATRRRILERLIEAEQFEHFLHSRYVGHKRFSLEGAETAIAILDELLRRAAQQDVHEVVIGMAHRGRLNVLANLIGMPFGQIFSSFESEEPTSVQGSGDVKYHLGATGVRTFEGRELVVSVSPNPSHLEAVDPVVEGIVRPKQDRLGDVERRRVIPLLVHGDAAFAGQGIVAETLNLSQLPGYCTGGTIHLIINNQIGFTTPPEEARSTPYPTDVARMVQAPIFHVNGDDPEAAIRAARLAFDYRQRFNKDVVIDMICYRRHGHNETDDPSYTQPLLYRKIREHPSVATLYGQRLVREGAISQEEIDSIRRRISESLDAAHKQPVSFVLSAPGPAPEVHSTAVDHATLERVVEGLTRFPADFHLHPKLRPFVERRREAFEKGGPIDWAFAEALAFGSLVLQGTPVRLSGQDSSRGTFSQRHAIFYDYENGHEYCPLRHLAPGQARFDVYDSSLSENAVLGFEFGYSLGDPLSLVLWEAQFGDFANGAQVIIDQFIAGAESKWAQPSGLVLLLPHGYEGQGPEHSSARVERFLQLCAEDNLRVINPTTPAQYFHALRRRARKPLIIFTPKSLLRHHRAVSTVSELTSGRFREVIGETGHIEPNRVTRLLLCSGKIYYDLLERQPENVAIARIEQLYPFPHAEVQDVIMRYPLTAEVVWVQEEPRNMGPWRFVQEQVQPLLAQSRRVLRYVGRPESASTATGSHRRHTEEQKAVVEAAFR
ncbi:MAG TPA: multifunctional oxoglutarate decarboxylase/oxoglutarate dehydrogenase thiamine pyrophosphate-binding subunit/dihydrolipoyllysine-residue succinyltransferase subunit [Bryobacteraceae bacterium]|nr:multifunctional oxoglutarate decarboxylase/oxoglutarate dehydrogenase thiamine pyrophosphate-binding subunit/dihydrolipoyllysine-residue succinyltransferase subunit [Bryobacteraceae bacterium]HOQ47043.1 multifunctional oxoglutarate decarboxylase/oxoglutarate dehydrogenase thiamine pyrophosphate-binding subunit/dihydrolipoyllysine-residue succinyltransferase subunit [Bryobacteraceae bacterium]HPQ14061.1 multifunctional oxoglutarate decarboxylase/oxoglutarate dehydrogenase thiamine pyrophosphate